MGESLYVYSTIHGYNQNDYCIKMGSNGNQLAFSLIATSHRITSNTSRCCISLYIINIPSHYKPHYITVITSNYHHVASHNTICTTSRYITSRYIYRYQKSLCYRCYVHHIILFIGNTSGYITGIKSHCFAGVTSQHITGITSHYIAGNTSDYIRDITSDYNY